MKKFDILTPLGIVVGLAMMLLGIFSSGGTGGLLSFFQVSSIFIVVGGVAGALLINYNLNELQITFKVMKEAFNKDQQDARTLIQTFVKLSDKARREGLLALETEMEDIEDKFIRKGILLAVDGIEPDVIGDILNAEISAMEERHRKGRGILEKAGEYAPAWGMIGTLIGLILMLRNLSDPSTLGPNMAIALLTTLYGSLLANLVFLPMAAKLANKSEEEVFMKQIIVEGVIGVQSGQNPKILEEKLSAFLPADQRNFDEEEVENDILGETVNEA
ncbi:flagellar motor protein MotP [Bacillus solimangrovi]|uniref:Flagellar motor protein MotP n=1 Tax=Bacillus solimangrovi TaxID=1305675 RepID=A0A1E5LCJ0_9BACI|nr:flagellar motor protein MotP [Bacillus solimangrovi]OEH91796.1 flagellar motor protein MotP [Bacillus solimangrovi]